MSNYYDSFINKYRVKNVQVSRDYQTFNYGWNKTASYHADREEIIEIELTRSGFEDLVNQANEHEKVWQDQRDEAWMRKTHSAVAEAYDKYRMLLELYR
jgi:hypothetical protein